MSSSPGQPETVASHPGTASYQPTEGIGTVLGHYTLEQKLGEGGMGSVWIARQTEPVKRRVALKLIKTGLDSRSLLARFEQERQALAVMDHPHIAKVYDAGIAHGQPYFVMELVRGPTLLHYCDEKKLTPRQRLELFIPICHAIQHAHQKGIIHRDLKPANILVATVDDMPVPKIIDFGVAKAVSGKLTDQSFNTALGTVVGTLEYMAPEQAVGNDDVDTRVDIYALGVILYELLVGVRPFDGNRLRQAALLEAIRIIQDEDPSKPSTRLSTVESLPTIAAVRQVEPRQLLNMLRGDLDWIIMKCLEKERSRRYDTANGLALELQRYLHDEPVLASPPSAAYRWKKFVKRNKGSVLAAGLILLTLLLGILATSWAAWEASQQASAARRERDQKEEARLAEHQAKLLTEKRLQQIQKAQQLLGSIFTALDPTAENKQGRTLRQILVERVMRAEKELTGDAIGDPATVAELQDILGQSYHGLGEFKRARTLFEQAEATTLKLTHPQHPEYLRIKSNRAANEASDGHYQLALDLFEGILVQRQAIHGRNHPKTMITISDIAGVWAGHMQRGDKAIPLYEEVIAFWKKQPDVNELEILQLSSQLCASYSLASQPRKALDLVNQILPAMEKHPDTPPLLLAQTYTYQCLALRELNQVREAIPPLERALALYESRLDKDHPDTLGCRNNLAALLWQTGQFARSVPQFEKILDVQERKMGPLHPNTLLTLANLAVNYRDNQQRAKALQTASVFLERFSQLPVASQVRSAWFLTDAADLYRDAHEPAKQLAMLEQYLAFTRKHFQNDHPDIAYAMNALASVHLEARQFAKAEPMLREALRMREKVEPNDWSTFNTRSLLGEAIMDLGQLKPDDASRQASLKEAGALLTTGYQGMIDRLKFITPSVQRKRLPEALRRLIRYAELMKQPSEAERWKREMEKWTK